MGNTTFAGAPSSDRSFDHYARLIRRFVKVPVALVTIIERDRQVFPGLSGLPEPFSSSRQTPMSHSFCQYVVRDDKPLVITDARLDPQLATNLAIDDLGVIAYAGWPVRDGTGRAVGSLCAIDRVPREWTQEDLDTLEDLAVACSAELQGSLRQAEDSESLVGAIFESVGVSLAFYDSDRNLILANRLAQTLATAGGFTLDRKPYAGLGVRRADNLTPVPFEEQIIARALAGQTGQQEMEWIGPPGHEVAIVASAQPVPRADGTRWGTLVAGQDVTRLARAQQVKDDFIATVSHELRTPLTSILLYGDALEDELDPGAGFVADSLAAIQRAALRLQERIGELLGSAERRRALDLASTDLAQLADEVCSTLGEQAKAAGLGLAVLAEEAQWAVVDARRIEQAIENVVTNAVKYTPRGGQVTITVTGHESTVEVIVSDNGVGMAPGELVQAFDTFWRADSARRQAVQGIGIGLTLVSDVLRQHHGTATIQSQPDQGTTVTLTIPRRPPSPTEATPARTSGSAARHPSSLRSVTYASSTSKLLTHSELIELLEGSRVRNAAAGITGMMLYHDGNVIQVLEGPDAAVEALLARIRLDPRHRDLLVLLEDSVERRAFQDWSMGFRDLSEADLTDHEGYSAYLNHPALQELGQYAVPVHSLLATFRENML